MPAPFLFDIGNVILFFDFQIAVRKVAAQCTLPSEQILPALVPFTEAFERGETDTATFVASASEKIGYSGTAADFIAALEDIFTVNEPMVRRIEALKAAGHPLYLLSNTNAIHVPYFTGRYDVFSLFDGATYSHEAGAMKPAAHIYEAAIKSFDLDPAATIYIDDLPANIEAGKNHGLRSILYRGDQHEEFESELQKHLSC